LFFVLALPESKKMKVSHVLKLLEEDGWQLVRTRGSHRQFKHPVKKGLVTVPGRSSDEIRKGTFGSILRQAKLNLK
jgi:predicted RNA binding protein YcfA (HicA-like mRNA interferase family)